jgi:hypothetical protein
MKKLLLAASCLIPFVAWGQSSPNWPTGYRPSAAEVNAEWASKQDVNSRFALYAINFGVKADGVTPDGAAMSAAITACSLQGTTLYLPAGQINMDGLVAGIPLSNCAVRGTGVIAARQTVPSFGTTLLLKSTSVPPFLIGSNWSINDLSFYWPDQTGSIVYPALMTSQPPAAVNWYMDHVNFVNPYDGIVQGAGSGFGSFIITNLWAYAVHDLFRMGAIGDGVRFSGLQLTPATWLHICGDGVPACNAKIDASSPGNTIFHFMAGPAVVMKVDSLGAFNWRTLIKMDTGSRVVQSDFDVGLDTVGTIIDNTANGTWVDSNELHGVATCGRTTMIAPIASNDPCFILGTTSAFRFNDLRMQGSAGSYFKTSGSTLVLTNSKFGNVGGANDGADYSIVEINGTGPGTTIDLRGNFFASGFVGTTHHYGVKGNGFAVPRMIIQANEFSTLNRGVDIASSATTVINGNWSIATTTGPAIVIAGINGISYGNNFWDKPPVATIASGFGTGPSVASNSDAHDFAIVVGTGGTDDTGVVTLGIRPLRNKSCSVVDQTNSVVFETVATAVSPVAIQLMNFSRTTGIRTPWTAGDTLLVSCGGY